MLRFPKSKSWLCSTVREYCLKVWGWLGEHVWRIFGQVFGTYFWTCFGIWGCFGEGLREGFRGNIPCKKPVRQKLVKTYNNLSCCLGELYAILSKRPYCASESWERLNFHPGSRKFLDLLWKAQEKQRNARNIASIWLFRKTRGLLWEKSAPLTKKSCTQWGRL